jgi:hypothetical protein
MFRKFMNGFNSFKRAIEFHYLLFNYDLSDYENWLQKYKVSKNLYRMSDKNRRLRFFNALNGANILGNNKSYRN